MATKRELEAQIQELEEENAELQDQLDAIADIVVPEEELVQRLLGRAREQRRRDDTPETIRQRLRVYEERTALLVRYYEDRGLVRTVDGVALGRIVQLFETGANDVIVVQGDRERLIPYIWQQVVRDVDLEAGVMLVDWDPAF